MAAANTAALRTVRLHFIPTEYSLRGRQTSGELVFKEFDKMANR
jgi:hypothetical protein